jgi:hypothetical protein
MAIRRQLACTLLLCVFINAHGAPRERFECPLKLSVDNGPLVLREPPPGFEPLVSHTVVFLTGASAFDGPPADGAMLKPLSATTEATHWDFGGVSQGKWLSCDYANGVVRLVRQVDDAVSSCTARWIRRGGQAQRLAQVECY